ncbi:MAG: response regulator transcription factor [Acidimicrobiia bacterium]|nr:response regulator transcription factor [Acidimicrobiia bacterium]
MRVVIVEDHALLRAGLVELLTAAGFDIAGQAGDAQELLELVRHTIPDVVVLDIRMPPTHTLEGLQAARAIRDEHGTAIGIVLLSQYVEARHAVDLLVDGAAGVGYLLKDRILDPAELTDAIRRVGNGGSAIDPIVIEQLLKRRQTDGPLAALTDREREVLFGMAEGRSNQSIAAKLHISDKTVEACTGRIFTKLGLEPGPDDHRRVRAVLTHLKATDKY